MADPSIPANLKANVKESYDKIAPTYNKWTAELPNTSRLHYLDKILATLPSSGTVKVLELGCGAGVPISEKLASIENVYVTANDMSSTQIAVAKENLSSFNTGSTPKVEFIESDMMSLDFPAETFDAVVAFYSIIHLPRDEQTQLVSHISKWLKPGGYILANFGAAESVNSTNEHWLHEEGWMFWSSWGVEGSVKMFQNIGFEIAYQEIQKVPGDAEFLWVLARKQN